MKHQKKKKIFEFFTLLSMIVGIVIGSGMFVKNDNGPNHILWFAKENGYIAIIAWITVGLSCLIAMLAFIEIASSTEKNENGTLPNWTNKFISRKAGSFISIFFIFIYIPILYAFFSLLLVQYFLKVTGLDNLSHTKQDVFYFLLGLTFFLTFTITNSLSTKFGKWFQMLDSALKAIPFILILIGGFCLKNNENVFSNQSAPWSAANFFLVSGPILFSFDGFVFAANLQKETKNKELLYKALIIGMIIVVFVYVLEAIALFMGTSTGSVFDLFNKLFGNKAGSIINWLIILVIFTSLNGYSIVGSRYILLDSQSGLLYTFGKKVNLKYSGLITAGIGLFYFFFLGSLGMFVNGGIHSSIFDPIYYLDEFSNIISIFSFTLYAILMIAMIVNRFTKKVKIHKKLKIAPAAGITSSILLMVFVSYRLYDIIKAFDISSLLLLMILVINIVFFTINEILLKKQYDEEKYQLRQVEILNITKKNNSINNINKILK